MRRHRSSAVKRRPRSGRSGKSLPRPQREALLEGARVLEAMQGAYEEDARGKHAALWKRRARDARRYARALRLMAA